MGLKFGNLTYLRGVIYFKTSPFEQRPFAGFFSKGFPKFVRKVREEIFYWAVPITISYAMIDFAIRKTAESERKNPADYEHEE